MSGPSPLIAGRWFNASGSWMDLEVTDGRVSGRYHTALGETTGAAGFEISGWVTPFVDGVARIAFSVCWHRDGEGPASVTAWCGRAQVGRRDGKNIDIIDVTWIMSSAPDEPASEWKSRVTGHSEFRRGPWVP